MKQFRENHKGFTLIELLVAVAIGSIVIGAIAGILVVSSRNYTNASAEASMQSTAQIVMNHIHDVAIDTNQKVTYTWSDEAAAPASNDDSESSWVPVSADSVLDHHNYKKLSFYNYDGADRNRRYDFIFDATDTDNGKLYYQEYKIDNSFNIIDETGGHLGDPLKDRMDLLGENLTGFACDLSRVETRRLFSVVMDFEKAKRTYHSENNVSLRNKVSVSRDGVAVSDNVIIGAARLVAEPGMTIPLGGNPINVQGTASTRVIYELESTCGKTSSATTLDGTGKNLVVGADEQADVIEVTVRSEAIPTVEAILQVYINRVFWTSDVAGGATNYDTIEGITVTGDPTIKAGEEKTYDVHVQGNLAPGCSETQLKAYEFVGLTAEHEGVNCSSKASFDPDTHKLKAEDDIEGGTKISLTFRSTHSTANGGMAIRTQAYPVSGGITKTVEITVEDNGNPLGDSAVFPRGARVGVFPPELMPACYYIRIIARRPVLDSEGEYINYGRNDGWDYSPYSDVPKDQDPVWSHNKAPGYRQMGEDSWVRLTESGSGYSGTIQVLNVFPGTERELDYDYLIQSKVVQYTDTNYNVVKPGGCKPLQDGGIIYGLRINTGKRLPNSTYTDPASRTDLGIFYQLEMNMKHNPNSWTHDFYLKYWQKNLTVRSFFYSLKNVTLRAVDSSGRDVTTGNLSFQGDWSDDPSSRASYYDPVQRRDVLAVSDLSYMASTRKVEFKKDAWESFKDKGVITLYSGFHYEYDNQDYVRRRADFILSAKSGGNATIKARSTGNTTNRDWEAFIPYPAHVKDGIARSAHDDFPAISTSDTYQEISLGNIIISDSNHPNGYYASPGTVYAKTTDGSVYLFSSVYGEFKYNNDTERWEPTDSRMDTAYNIRVRRPESGEYDNFVPYPSHVLFWGSSYDLTADWKYIGMRRFVVNNSTISIPCRMRKDNDHVYLWLMGYGGYSIGINEKKWTYTPASREKDKLNAHVLDVDETRDTKFDMFVPYPGHPFDFTSTVEADGKWHDVGVQRLKSASDYPTRKCFVMKEGDELKLYINGAGIYLYDEAASVWRISEKDTNNIMLEDQSGAHGLDAFLGYPGHPMYLGDGKTLTDQWQLVGTIQSTRKNDAWSTPYNYTAKCYLKMQGTEILLYIEKKGIYRYIPHQKEWEYVFSDTSYNLNFNYGTLFYVPVPGDPEFFTGFDEAERGVWNNYGIIPMYYCTNVNPRYSEQEDFSYMVDAGGVYHIRKWSQSYRFNTGTGKWEHEW